MGSLQNPRKLRYTWETLTHLPTLRLFLFAHEIKPLNQCRNLKVSLNFEDLLLMVTWLEEIKNPIGGSFDFSVKVPVPRVLVDLSSPVDFKAMEDHIEVKLVLLLPVDHPLFMNFDSDLNISDKKPNGGRETFEPLQSLSDLNFLSSQDGVHFCCKNCSMKLTKYPLRSFAEMPSADWREVADNWFGNCCCSFGGISEKLVKQYSSSYLFSKGTFLLDASCVVVSNNDLQEDVLPDCFDQNKEINESCGVSDEVITDYIIEPVIASGSNCGLSLFAEDPCKGTSTNKKNIASPQICDSISWIDEKLTSLSLKKESVISKIENEAIERENNVDTSPCIFPTTSGITGNTKPDHVLNENDWDHCCTKTDNIFCHDNSELSDNTFVTCSKKEEVTKHINAQTSQKSLLNVSLGNGFMVRNSNLCKDVDWMELKCPHCSSIIGAYPSTRDVRAPADGGVRLFKCYTSTLFSIDESKDIFRKHTLHTMFVNQLMESAHDELSFRTVVRDLRTRSPLLQIVLLNSNAWSCTGNCLETEDIVKLVPKIELYPVYKVLFADCSNATETQSRMLDEWATKNQADEVFMFPDQVKYLTDSLKSAMNRLPLSCSSMQGLSLSSVER